jgi:pentatricopeptide repeat protein
VLKGFSHQKKFGRVWSVYQEMLAEKMDFSIVTYNTLVDACARCTEMARVPTLLEDMQRQNIEPNLITYGAILKGYCQEGKLDRAYELLDSMRKTTRFKPDEIMFNSLLDGCARQGLWERGIASLEEMEQEGIKPSNFTLSILVKLASRSKRLDAAFEICESITKKYRFRLNVHVFSNLVHACVNHKDLNRALGVLERMLRERVKPDVRTYTLLLKGLVAAGEHRDADGVLRAALAMSDPHEKLAGFSASQCKPDGGLPKALISEVIEGIACGRSEVLAVKLLQDTKRLGLTIDPKVKLRLATRATN